MYGHYRVSWPLMPDTPTKTEQQPRCKNCKKRFIPKRPWQKFCKAKCRNDYGNYGQTPHAQMVARMKSYFKSEEFRGLLREAIDRFIADRERKPGPASQ
jgi:hypothetical protein